MKPTSVDKFPIGTRVAIRNEDGTGLQKLAFVIGTFGVGGVTTDDGSVFDKDGKGIVPRSYVGKTISSPTGREIDDEVKQKLLRSIGEKLQDKELRLNIVEDVACILGIPPVRIVAFQPPSETLNFQIRSRIGEQWSTPISGTGMMENAIVSARALLNDYKVEEVQVLAGGAPVWGRNRIHRSWP